MLLTLMLQKTIYEQSLPEKTQGQYWIKCGVSSGDTVRLLSVEGAGDAWIIKSNKSVYICQPNGAVMRECALEPLRFYHIKIAATNEDALLYCERSTENRRKFTKLILPSNGQIGFGRDSSNDIVYTNNFVSASHAQIVIKNGGISILDRGSSNGTFVNGKKISDAKLVPGDVVFIMGCKIIIGKGFISINNPDEKVRINNSGILAFKRQEIVHREPSLDASSSTISFFRSPRFKRDIKTLEITVDSPPASPSSEQMPLLLTIGPSATMGLASLTMATTSIINLANGNSTLMTALPMLVMSFAMLCGTLLWPTIIKNYEKKKKQTKEALRQEKYKAYINTIKAEIDNECSYQSEILNENAVSLDVCLSRIKLVQRNLWERTAAHNDFLTLRLGKGTVELDCDIKSQKRRFTIDEDSLQELQYTLCEQQHTISNAPIVLPLREDIVTGIIGNKRDVNALAKSLLFQTVALHSYDEVKVIVICGEDEEEWKFAKWLPHVWDDDYSIRFFASNSSEIKAVSAYIERVISERIDKRDYDVSDTPQYVVFALDQGLAERADFMKLLYRQKKYCGFSVLAMYNELKNLPKECRRIIELSPQRSRIYDREDISGAFLEFTPEFFTGGNEEEYAVALSNIKLDTTSDDYSIPNMITFLECYDVGKAEHLNILSRWKENDPTRSLDAIVGVDAYGERFSLDIHEKYHGPHGLIAGTTGSGKSEFIMTYILALAINYHPSEVAFILIDYKGGGMAKAFERLPHTAGIITNLDGSEVNRSLVSIKSELRRRQALFNQASKQVGMSNIDIYKYQRLRRDNIVPEPLPHLVIISDEFAELKAQQPEFMAELISTARIGRSLGVHLILATQKPTGVVDDQIVSNTRFRVCLKVQDKQDSMEMLKRPEAADLTATGRFYLQVGNNELFKLGQSAWTGAKYIPSDRVTQQADNSLSIIDSTGKTLRQVRLKNESSGKSISQLDAITQCISGFAKQEGFEQRMLWCPSMPPVITTKQVIQKYSLSFDTNVRPVIGEYDLPELQTQRAMLLDFATDGNVIVFGASGSGKTTLVTTLLCSLITQYTPDLVNIYALDFSAQTLAIFNTAPHVGDVVLSDDAEKVANLFKLLHSELKRRKQLLQEYGGDFVSYQRMSGKALPGIVVVVHNYTGLTESYEVDEDIAQLSREGQKRGIYFILTAQSAGAVRYRTLQNFGQTYVLRMNDPLDYSAILGNVGATFPAPYLGRGIFKTNAVYEFQTARCASENEIQYIRQLCLDAASNWNGECACSIAILPNKVNRAFLTQAVERSQPEELPIGVDRERLTVVNYPIFGAALTWILSDSGNNQLFIQGLAETAAMKKGIQVTVIDPTDHFILDGGRDYSYASGNEDVNNAVSEIFGEMLRRHKQLKEEPNAVFERILCIITSMNALEENLTEENRTSLIDALNNISQKYYISFVISETGAYLNSAANKEWVRSHTSFKDAIWLGGGITSHFRLQIDKPPKNAREAVASDSGFVLINGVATAAKLLVPMNWSIEEE